MRLLQRPVLLATALAAAAASLSGAGPAYAEPAWAPAGTATIRPGVQTVTAGGQCTANYVFYDSANNVYVGQAAHCATTSGATTTNGCQAGSRPLGTPVTVRGATRPGTLVYSSWIAMRAANEPVNSPQCNYNDFALVKLDPADYGRVNPSIPFFGGPNGLNTTGTRLGRQVYSYGNSGLRLGLSPLSPKYGIATGTGGSGWTHTIYTATPGIPGDSGSAVLDEAGNAIGVLATLSALGSNGAGDISRELAYMRSHSSFTTVQLALGTEPFSAT